MRSAAGEDTSYNTQRCSPSHDDAADARADGDGDYRNVDCGTVIRLREQLDKLISIRHDLHRDTVSDNSAAATAANTAADNRNGDHATATNWQSVQQTLKRLPHTPSNLSNRCSMLDDPIGRLLICQILSRHPPTEVVRSALDTFPDAVQSNPAAFFTACKHASSDVLTFLIQYESTRCCDSSTCPYPWILSDNVSVESTRTIVEACPEGILLPSPYLCDCSPLDYILMSSDMIHQRSIDVKLWNKFKLFLVVAHCLNTSSTASSARSRNCNSRSAAAHTSVFTAPGTSPNEDGSARANTARTEHPLPVLLDLILSRSCEIFGDEHKAQHVLWIMHQLRWTDGWLFQKECCDRQKSYPIHYVLLTKCKARGIQGLRAARELVKIILEANPSSAKEQVSGRLALHMALENGWPCHDLLLSVHPDALNEPDPKTGLFPFQTAAMYDWCRSDHVGSVPPSFPAGNNGNDDDDAGMFDGVDDDDVDDVIIIDILDSTLIVDGSDSESDSDSDSSEEMEVDDHEAATTAMRADTGSYDSDDYDSDEDDDEHGHGHSSAATAAASTASADAQMPFGDLDVAYELLRANPAQIFVVQVPERQTVPGAQVGVSS